MPPQATPPRGSGARTRRRPTVAVIGAGVQGIGIALEMAARGLAVDLLEKSARVHGGASLANEGKIHLGYIYAHDPSLRTARVMVEGAWSFSSILRDWLEEDLADTFLSAPFDYLVHRESLLDPDTLGGIYRRIADLNRSMAAQPGATYFGRDGARPPEVMPAAARKGQFGPQVAAAFSTPEIAVDAAAIGEALRRRVGDDPAIGLQLGSEVVSATPRDDAVEIQVRHQDRSEVRRYDHVVNASWDDLLRIDATAGLPAPAGSSFRLRDVLRIPAPHGGRVPRCVSIVLGAYGDVVRYGSGDMFLSWYPVGRRDMVTTMRPPATWSTGPSQDEAAEVRAGTLAGLQPLLPALRTLDERAVATATVHAGVIYARGTTDIDDHASGFHERHAIGPRSRGRFHSVDTGKYTTAPLFARRLARHIAGASR